MTQLGGLVALFDVLEDDLLLAHAGNPQRLDRLFPDIIVIELLAAGGWVAWSWRTAPQTRLCAPNSATGWARISRPKSAITRTARCWVTVAAAPTIRSGPASGRGDRLRGGGVFSRG